MTTTTVSKMKQVIVVRTDLEMGKGKIAAQVAHASVNALLSLVFAKPRSQEANDEQNDWFFDWWGEEGEGDQYKIVLKVNTVEELMQIASKAQEAELPRSTIRDRGHTQIPEGTITCIGIGPAPSELIDKITGGLKLL